MPATTAHDLSILAAVGLLWLLAMAAPGPDFLVVTRLAVSRGRHAAMAATLGIASGVGLWGLAGFFGIHALFVASPWLYLGLKLVGGSYLIFLGLRALIGSLRPPAALPANAAPASTGFAYRLGLLTNLANPKAPIFVSSLFAATMPQHAPVALGIGAVALMVTIAVAWFALVVRFLTLPGAARMVDRLKHWIERAAGAAFIGFGAKLVLEREG